MSLDLTKAVAANDTLLRLSTLPYNTRRRNVVLLVAWQEAHGLDPDGIYDRATEESLNNALLALEEPPEFKVEPDEPVIRHPGTSFPLWPGPTPMTSAQWYAAVGTPGPPGSEWDRRNIVDVKSLDERKAKDGGPASTGMHRLAAPYGVEGIGRVRSTGYVVKRCGGYVYRRIRHDPERELSKHASGLALDVNSNANFSRYFDEGDDGPEPFSPAWLKIWDSPDAITREAVEAMESCGWKWGGRWKAPRNRKTGKKGRGFRDPMHFQR